MKVGESIDCDQTWVVLKLISPNGKRELPEIKAVGVTTALTHARDNAPLMLTSEPFFGHLTYIFTSKILHISLAQLIDNYLQ